MQPTPAPHHPFRASGRASGAPPFADNLRERATRAATGLLGFAAVQLAAAVLQRSELGAVTVQAVIAEWCAGRAGILWSPAHGPMPSAQVIARRALRGAALAFAAAGGGITLALASGGASIVPNVPAPGLLVTGLLVAGATAVRDELLLHGLIFRVFAGAIPRWGMVLICGLASGAVVTAEPGVLPLEVAGACLCGAALGALWALDQGGWMPWGARTAWVWVTRAVVHGGVVDVRSAAGFWGGGSACVENGGAMLLALAIAVVSSTLVVSRSGRRPEAA